MPNPTTSPTAEYVNFVWRRDTNLAPPAWAGGTRCSFWNLIVGYPAIGGNPAVDPAMKANDVLFMQSCDDDYREGFLAYDSARNPQQLIDFYNQVEYEVKNSLPLTIYSETKNQANILYGIETSAGVYHKWHFSAGNEISSAAAAQSLAEFLRGRMENPYAGNYDVSNVSTVVADQIVATPSNWSDVGIIYDTRIIPFYAIYYLAPAVMALREVEAAIQLVDPTRNILIGLGSLTNLRNPGAITWLQSLLDFVIPSTCPTVSSASGIRGKKVRELVNFVDIHYLTQSGMFNRDINGKWIFNVRTTSDTRDGSPQYEWERRYNQVWDACAITGTSIIKGIIESETCGVRATAPNVTLGGKTGLQAIFRTLWFAQKKNKGPRFLKTTIFDYWTPGDTENPGGGNVYWYGSAWKAAQTLHDFFNLKTLTIDQFELYSLNPTDAGSAYGITEGYVWRSKTNPKQYAIFLMCSDYDDTLTAATSKGIYQSWLAGQHKMGTFPYTAISSIDFQLWDSYPDPADASGCTKLGRKQSFDKTQVTYSIDTINQRLSLRLPSTGPILSYTPHALILITAV